MRASSSGRASTAWPHHERQQRASSSERHWRASRGGARRVRRLGAPARALAPPRLHARQRRRRRRPPPRLASATPQTARARRRRRRRRHRHLRRRHRHRRRATRELLVERMSLELLAEPPWRCADLVELLRRVLPRRPSRSDSDVEPLLQPSFSAAAPRSASTCSRAPTPVLLERLRARDELRPRRWPSGSSRRDEWPPRQTRRRPACRAARPFHRRRSGGCGRCGGGGGRRLVVAPPVGAQVEGGVAVERPLRRRARPRLERDAPLQRLRRRALRRQRVRAASPASGDTAGGRRPPPPRRRARRSSTISSETGMFAGPRACADAAVA